jgi:CMP-N-acetylneuraminic acid synthetase
LSSVGREGAISDDIGYIMLSSNKRVIGVVPIKLNNERVPNKNLRTIFGKPFVTAILEKMLQVSGIDRIYCYCSSSVILDYLPMGVLWSQRDSKYDASNVTGEQLFQSIGQCVESDTTEVYVVCSATAPFLSVNSIQQCIDIYINNEYDSVCTALAHNGRMWYQNKPIGGHDGFTCPRSQDTEPVYIESEGCWVISADSLRMTGRRIGFNPHFVPVSQIECIDINTWDDLDFMHLIERGLVH